MTVVRGQLVVDGAVEFGELSIEDGLITDAALLPDAPPDAPFLAPGFVDVHVHGWGGHSAMGDRVALDGMSRALLRRGVTSFLPTAITAPLDVLTEFAARVRDWLPYTPDDGAEPLGFNLEGPFLADARRGAQDPTHLRVPTNVPRDDLAGLLESCRLITVAPELPGALELIAWLDSQGVRASIGHSAATFEQARSGYAAGATTTTHLFTAMSGVDHRSPGVALAALLTDEAYVEMIADGVHVALELWPLVLRLKAADRLILVSDAIPLTGTGDGRGKLGSLDIEIHGERVTLTGTDTLAGSALSLDKAVRNLVDSGVAMPVAVAAASTNPLAMLGITDRGRLAAGQRADLVELDATLNVSRVMRAGEWVS